MASSERIIPEVSSCSGRVVVLLAALQFAAITWQCTSYCAAAVRTTTAAASVSTSLPTAGVPLTEEVDIDLRHGIVKGYSQYISFLSSPSPVTEQPAVPAASGTATTNSMPCSARAVVRIDLSSTFNRVRLALDYDRARLWTLDVADSPSADGYGGGTGSGSRGSSDVSTSSTQLSTTAAANQSGEDSMAETQVFNEQMRIYGNALPGHRDASIDGGFLLKIVDGVVDRKHTKLVLDASDERIEWRARDERKQFIESKFLYSLSVGPRALYVGLNRVIASEFRSGSGLCRAVITLFADHVDRCRAGQSQCHTDAICHNTTKSFRCKCKDGFYGNGKICVDYNECEFENGGCVHNCANSHGNYTCSCFEGFQVSPRSVHNCIDRDECITDNGGCEHVCVNTVGSYHCRCHEGFFLASNGKTCVPGSNWCFEQLGCAHHCHSTALGTKCGCRKGFRLLSNGKDCITTCSRGNGGCHHRCTDGRDGPVCSCHDKYSLKPDGSTCVATCGVNNGGCDRRCEDTSDGPVCSCPDGFQLDIRDNKTCHDVDECKNPTLSGCSHDCVNSHGSFECVCPTGFRVAADLKTCQDVNECDQHYHTCDHLCNNTNGSYHCTCLPGYEIYGDTHCADKNECSANNGGCEHRCENNEGSYRCECHDGYQLHANKRDCVELVRCPILRAPAKATLNCSTGTDLEVCRLGCRGSSQFTSTVGNKTMTTWCGAQTGYRWLHDLQNITLPSCSEQVLAPGYKGRAKFMFFAERCPVRKSGLHDFEQQLSPILVGEPDSCENDLCSVTFLDLKCDSRKRKFRHLASNNVQTTLMSAEFEMQVKPSTPTASCSVDCTREENLQRLRRSLRRLRSIINDNVEKFAIQYEGKNYEVVKRSLRAYKPRDVCEPGQVLTDKKCVSCSLATWYSLATGTCEICPAGTYQDQEGQISCKPCPHGLHGVGLEAAKSVAECGVACRPGTYSTDGLAPCKQCPLGTYQSDYGRTLCVPCGTNIMTAETGATGFQQCLVKEKCRAGQYYSRDEERCVSCPRDTYQPMPGQNFCIDCPGDTQTDTDGAISSIECKDRTCLGQTDGQQGFIQSPNWPGTYPANVECTWRITPEKGRRILIVIPEIHIAAQDKCRDSLVMRKSASPYSLTTYETCESTSTPLAFTARSKNLWIYFKSDGTNSARGFSIPYVTYSEEYQELIDDIVRDGRLYSSYQHQEVLKDGRLLSTLLEVIAQPYNYFKYANVSHSMFPESFIRLLRNKVVRFFN